MTHEPDLEMFDRALVKALAAECDQLRAEVERLKRANARMHALVRDVAATRDTAVNMHLEDVAKIERLTAENARLKEIIYQEN